MESMNNATASLSHNISSWNNYEYKGVDRIEDGGDDMYDEGNQVRRWAGGGVSFPTKK